MKKWMTPALVVVGFLVVGFGIRSIIVKRSASTTAASAAEAGENPDELGADIEDEERIDPDTEEDWEQRHHAFVGYPAEPAAAAEIKISHVKGKAEHPLDDMVPVPAGEVQLGDKTLKTASPEHQVFVAGFMIDRYEVTNGQYAEFLKRTKHRQPELADDWAKDYSWREQMYPVGTKDRPVVLVSLTDAMAYCRWAGKRLPTEAEWEKAARGPQSNAYPWGPDWNGTRAHTAERFSGPLKTLADWNKFEESFDEDALIHPFPVGSYPEDVSAFEAYDMHGNVSEWVDGVFEAYDEGDEGASQLYGRKDVGVVRGNSYANRDYAAPMAVRYPYLRTHLDATIGFRCAKDM